MPVAPVIPPTSPEMPPTSDVLPVEQSSSTPNETKQNMPSNPDTLLPWIFGKSLTHNNWHNVRVICDIMGLSPQMKEELCATVWGESEFNTNARLDNKDKAGRVWSSDLGICQWNTYWHGKEITSDESVNDPEKAVRLMCKYFLNGQADAWVAHSSGRYKKFLNKKL